MAGAGFAGFAGGAGGVVGDGRVGAAGGGGAGVESAGVFVVALFWRASRDGVDRDFYRHFYRHFRRIHVLGDLNGHIGLEHQTYSCQGKPRVAHSVAKTE